MSLRFSLLSNTIRIYTRYPCLSTFAHLHTHRATMSSANISTATGSNIQQTRAPATPFEKVLADMANKDLEISREPIRHTRPALPQAVGKPSITFQNIEICESSRGTTPSEIHLFGVTKAGHSILVRIMGFEHYLYYPAPPGISEDDMNPLREYLNELLRPSSNPLENINSPISKIEIEDQKTKPTGSELRDLFTSSEFTYEARVPYFLRFMVDTQIGPMAWLKLPTDKYEIVSTDTRVSHCQLEVFIDVDDLMACQIVENREKIAPLRIFSYDIETDVANGKFPDAQTESIIQIGAMLTEYGRSVPFVRKIFTLRSCNPIEGAQVESFDDEADMLTAWQKFFIECDPDIVTGFNLTQFDIPYLLKRARTLGLDNFACLGRIKGSPQLLNPGPTTNFNCPGYEGRLLLDIFPHVREYYPGLDGQGAYRLGNVSARFLEETKEDMPYTDIPICQRGDAETRRKLAIYCLKDVYLPLRLMSKLQCIENEVRSAKGAYLPLNYMRNRQGLSTTAMRCREAIVGQYIIRDQPMRARPQTFRPTP